MASLGSGNWTIAGANASLPNGIDVSRTRRKKYANLKLTMASGEWPAAGIAMPGAGSIGMITQLDYYILSPRVATASGRMISYTLTTGHKIRAIAGRLTSGNGTALLPLATTITNAARIFHVTAVGW